MREQRQRRSGSRPLRDSARSPPSLERGSPATGPPELVPTSAGTEPTQRTNIRKLLPPPPAPPKADSESPLLRREIPPYSAFSRESPRPRIEKDRSFPAEAWPRRRAGAQSLSWSASRAVPSNPRRRSRRELRASRRGAVPPALVRHR